MSNKANLIDSVLIAICVAGFSVYFFPFPSFLRWSILAAQIAAGTSAYIRTRKRSLRLGLGDRDDRV